MQEFHQYLVLSQTSALHAYEKGQLIKVIEQDSQVDKIFVSRSMLCVRAGNQIKMYNEMFQLVETITESGLVIHDLNQIYFCQGTNIQYPIYTVSLNFQPNFAIAQDGQVLAVGGSQMALVKNGQVSYIEHERTITVAAFNPNGQSFAIGDCRGQITVFEFAKSGRYTTRKLHWHPQELQALCYSSDGHYIYSGGKECVLVRWHMESKSKSFLPRTMAAIDGIIQLQDGNVVVSLADNSINVLSPVDWSLVYRIVGVAYVKTRQVWNHPPLQCKTGVLAVNDNHAVITSVPGSLQFWSLKDNSCTKELQVCPRPRITCTDQGLVQVPTVTKCVFGGEWMATVDEMISDDSEVKSVLKFWKESKLISFFNQTETITDLVFVGSNKLVSCSSEIKSYALQVRERRSNPNQMHEQYEVWVNMASADYRNMCAQCMAVSEDGSVLVIAYDKVLTIRDPSSLELRGTLVLQDYPVKFMQFNSQVMLMVATETQVTLWNLLKRSAIWSQEINCRALAYQDGNITVASSEQILQVDPYQLTMTVHEVDQLVGLVSFEVYLDQNYEFRGLKKSVVAVQHQSTTSLLNNYLIQEDTIEQERQVFKAQKLATMNFDPRSSHLLPNLAQMLAVSLATLVPRKQ